MKSKWFMMITLLLALGGLIFSGCAATNSTAPGDGEGATGLANPASVYCEEQSYILEIREGKDGGQYGVCIFPDGTECDEWAFFRGECEVGGQTTVEVETSEDTQPAQQESTTTEIVATEDSIEAAQPASQEPSTGQVSELANPASVYCEEQGYILEIREGKDGGQYGVCVFPDGTACEEWAFFRGECAPGETEKQNTYPSKDQPVTGWLGYVASTPDGAQFDDYLILEGNAGEVGLNGATDELEAEIVALRDKPEPGKYAHFWGTLTCDVPDYGGCNLHVERIRSGATFTEPELVEGWEGTIISQPEGAQFDDTFILAGDYPVGFGISAALAESGERELENQIGGLRDTGTVVRIWGQLITGVPDSYGSQIEVDRIEIR